MTILQVISSSGYYGAESMLLTLAEGLARLGCDSKVAVFDDARDPHTELASMAAGKGIGCATIACHGRWDRNAVRSLANLTKEFQADIVHAHGYKADLYSLAAAASRAFSKTAAGKPALFSTCHNWPDPSVGMQMYAKLDRAALRFFDHVTTPSPAVEAKLLDSGVSSVRVSFVRNGIDVARFSQAAPEYRKEAGIGDAPLIGFVGRLTHAKGGDVLIRAARKVVDEIPEARFIFAGEGSRLEEWTALATGLGLAGNVTFLGSRKDMPSIYASLSVLTLPSYDEAMPMCLLEGMAAGLPVVATPVGAVPEVVTPDETGLLTPAGDADALSQAILRILNDRPFARGLGNRARERVMRDYSSDAMAGQYAALYENAMSSRTIVPGNGKAARKQTAST